MSVVCPTVTAYTVDEYSEQIATIESFARRIHIDLGDGDFAKRTVDIKDVWWPKQIRADIHLMYRYPEQVLAELIATAPAMVTIHAEASGDLAGCIQHLHKHGIRAGIALLQKTTVESAHELIELSDHVLLFSGSLGSFGGTADLSLLRKVKQLHAINPSLEIGWDGGISTENATQLVAGGIEVLHVGGAIQKANHPENVYRELERQLSD